MKFEYFIATKYFLKGRRHGFVSLIAVISILGVAVGVMALIVVLAVMSGFDRELKSKIVGVQPHVILQGIEGVSNPEEVRNMISSLKIPEISSIAPFVQGQGLVRSANSAVGVVIKGIDPEHEPMDVFQKHMRFGTLEFDDIGLITDSRTKWVGRAIMGEELAQRLRVSSGDVVTIISPAFKEDPTDAIRRAKSVPFVVSGIFRLGMSDFDLNLVLVNLKQGRALYQLGDRVTGMSIRLTDVESADRIKMLIHGRFGTGYTVHSWVDLNRTFFRALQVEKRS